MTAQPRTVVVTGANSGIGAAIAARIVAGGERVFDISHVAGPARDGITQLVADLTDPAALEQAAEAAAASGATALVHNAGIILPAPLEQIERGDLDHVVSLHLNAAIRLAQALLPAMTASGAGRIVLISSRAMLGVPTRSVYSATKAALVGLTRTWALELGGRGITVNAVSPGPIATDMFHGLIPAGSEREQALARSIPLGRIGCADDVAAAVTFFLGPDANFITGQNLFVCGGSSIGAISL